MHIFMVCLCYFLSGTLLGQTRKVGFNILTPKLEEQEKEVYSLWEKYLKDFNMDSYIQSSLWSQKERLLYAVPDIDIVDIAIASDGFITYYPLVLNIQQLDSFFVIKTAFVGQKDSVPVLHSIYNVIAKKEGNVYKLHRFIDHYTKNYKYISVPNITFFYPPSHAVKDSSIIRSIDFNHHLASFFQTSELDFKFYVFENTEQRIRAKGFDYNYLMFNSIQISGDVDPYSRIIYSGNGSEYYPHEMVHLYTNKLYSPVNIFFDEGICTFLAGNLESFSTDMKNLKYFLSVNKNPVEEYMFKKTSEKKTNIKYAIAGIICAVAYEKMGLQGFKTLCTSPNSELIIFETIEKVLGIKKQDLNAFIRKELEKY